MQQSRSSAPVYYANGMLRRSSVSPARSDDSEHLHDKKEDKIPLLRTSYDKTPSPTVLSIQSENKTEPHEQRRLLDVILVFLVLLFAESARGIVLPTLAPYVDSIGGDSVLLGYAVAAFSVGRFTSTIGLGYLSTRLSYKTVLAWSVLFCILGNAMYSFGPVFGVYVMLASRFIAGVGAGTLSVVRAYVAHVTSTSERTSYMSFLGAVQFLGFAITPGIGSGLSFLPTFYIFGLPINEYTYPGWFLAATNGIVLVLLLAIFKNPPPHEPKTTLTTMGESVEIKPVRSSAVKKAFFVFLALNLLVRLVLGILETLGTQMYIDLWNDEGKAVEAGFVFAAMGVVGICVLFLISYISKFVQDFMVMEVGLLCLTLGCGLLIGSDVGLPRFIIGAGLIWCVGFPLAQTIIVSMFSKILGKTPQGTMMGWIGAMGSLGRIFGPVGAGYLYDNLGQSAAMLFGVAMSVASILVTLLILPKRRQQI